VRAQREFPKSSASVAAARNFTRDTLTDLSPDLLESLVLMTSELSTNALLHTSGRFLVTINRTSKSVRVAVTDNSAMPPVKRFPNTREAHGRGLQIVSKLSDAWGSTGISGDGKTVWIRVDLRASASIS
jgi:two-component sensor histidine kinase